ncbi:outer membrane beta-barrel protein [Fulvivirga sp. M361]|uniref:TonB-dependent receptor family protein n=1 Tax=Fulvivirga sp. M361 TaxID=2594266 RepID=UPI00117ADA02|nr:TonB-dependent receptor family protein [Fulvivirga sp. M361]TRX61821.1 outer membrane beta-barrel protein [Fulvivirga sp. M361]
MRYYCLLCCLFCFQFSYSQVDPDSAIKKIRVEGKVMDSLKNELPYAHVVFTSIETQKKVAAVTQDQGLFSIQLTPGEYTVEVSFLGYLNHTQTYFLQKDTTLPAIVLKEGDLQLDEVVIKAELEKDIEHSATGMTFNIKNDSLYKKLSIIEVLSFLPGVQLDEEGNVSLEGSPATIMLNGRSARLSKGLLNNILETMQGDQIERIELISTPSAKHGGRVKTIIDIDLKKQRKDGISGSASVRARNANLSVFPSVSLNYKIGKLIFSGAAGPYSYARRVSSSFVIREPSDRSLFFNEEQKTVSRYDSRYSRLGVDYTINKYHSIGGNVGFDNANTTTKTDFTTEKFEQENLLTTQLNFNDNSDEVRSHFADLAYRYDIGEKGARLDIAGNYRLNDTENNHLNSNELVLVNDLDSITTLNRDKKAQNNRQVSGRLDYTLPIKNRKWNFETGLKYDFLSIEDNNVLETFNEGGEAFQIDPTFTNSFEYREEVYAGYASVASNHERLKYSLGVRVERVETRSFSITSDRAFNNSFNNVLPVIIVKYMLGEKQTSNINASYRKGYNLPPYIQLNPFEVFVNSTMIRRGNPKLTQSIYHLLKLGYTLKNKYFFSVNANFYNNLFASTQLLENDVAIMSYQNLGTRSLYRLNFNTNFKLVPWWRVNIISQLIYSVLDNNRTSNKVFTGSATLANTFTLPADFVLNIRSSFSNGEAYGFGEPNRFIRVNSTASVSKQFFNKKARLSISVSDIFGVTNREKTTFVLDETTISARSEVPRPLMMFVFSYRFSSGEKINKKAKKTSGVDGSRF